MRRFALAVFVLAMLAILVPAVALGFPEATATHTDLVASASGAVIGDVRVWNDADFVYVKFDTAPGWYLFGTKVEILTDWSLIPQTNGNAAPERFTHQAVQDVESTYTQKIPITWPLGTRLDIAACAEAGQRAGSIQDVHAALPSVVTQQVLYGSDPRVSYWDIGLSGGTILDGNYTGWCADPHQPLESGWSGQSDVYCSYLDSIPANLIRKPDNLDSVNWVLNQDYVGNGTSWRVVQATIWKLLADNIWESSMTQAEVDQVNTIVRDALGNNGFEPRANEYVAVVVSPRDLYKGPDGVFYRRQPTLMVQRIPVSGSGSEASWARGAGFPGSDSSMYVNDYEITLPTSLSMASGSNSSLEYGSAFAIRGSLKSAGAGVDGQRVVLQSAEPGGAFRDAALSTMTANGGTFTFSVKPTRRTYYRVRFPGATGYDPAEPTASVFATPKVRLTRSTSWSTLRRYRTYTARGFVEPRHYSSSGKLTIRAYKKASNGKYYYNRSFTAKYSYYSSTKTRYEAAIKFTKPSSKGYWKLVAYHAADSNNARAYGSPDYIRVK